VSAQVVSVVVPVKDGARYLGAVLAAVAGQEVEAEVEILVIDSGSSDGSREIARRAGARVVEIAPEEFGHGRTRNLGMELARGERVAFLTQDATPASPSWLAALSAALDAGEDVGLAFGPHLPRPDTSPAVARELEEFFAGMGAEAVVQRAGAAPEGPAAFFSNVNSCVERACWEAVRFRDVAYAEDQAFARDALAAGWAKAYAPEAGVLHAHDYPWAQFMRRYFDEYRGLRRTTGHIEPVKPKTMLRDAAALAKRDAAWAAARGGGASGPRRAFLGARSGAHHAGRAVFSALGSRFDRLPAGVERRLSLEGTARDAAPAGRFGGEIVVPHRERYPWDFVGRFSTDPGAPLVPAGPGDADVRPLHIAWVIPPWAAGSGGHKTLLTVAHELERLGHSSSVWIHDPWGWLGMGPARARREIVENFAPITGGVFKGLDQWMGADVAMATGMESVYAVKALEGCKLKAYFVQDHEPSFNAWSAQAMWAHETYRAGFPCICASPWLRDRLRAEYGADAESFELAVDHGTYRDRSLERDPDTVVFYARQYTPRRGTELGILALAEVVRRRPGTRVVMYGDRVPPEAPFPYEHLGVASPERLAELYGRATVGIVLSLTNYSLVPQEMMASGLPVVDVRGASAETVFGSDGRLIALAEPEPGALADEVIALLEDPARRARVTAAAGEFVRARTWAQVGRTVEEVLRERLRRRAMEVASRARSPKIVRGADPRPSPAEEDASDQRGAVGDLNWRLS